MVKTDKTPSLSVNISSTKPKKPYKDTTQSLQERLHTLITRLSDSIQILQNWPESKTGDDSTAIHVETTAKLIASIHKTIDGIRTVEERTNVNLGGGNEQDVALADKLRQAAVPMDLLDMMDYANGLNSDCFARGMLKEALRQVRNLQERKRLLQMLASEVENGIKRRQMVKQQAALENSTLPDGNEAEDVEENDDSVIVVDKGKSIGGVKRKRGDDSGNNDEPLQKK